MRIQQLQLLLTLAEHGSLRASAEVLHLTQPALTKALRQLEEEVGTTLVVRTPQGVRLAPAGEILATHAANALRELDKARAEIDWQSRHKGARLAIGLSPVAGIVLAPGAIASFCARMPEVRVRIVDAVFPRAQALVRSGELDLAIGPLPPDEFSRDLKVRPLFDTANVVVARQAHPLVQASRLAELAAARWVLVGPRGGPGDPDGLSWTAAGLTPPECAIECESYSTLLALLAGDDLLATVPRGFLERYGEPMSLRAVPVRDELPVTTIHSIRRASGPLSVPALTLMANFMSAAMPGARGVLLAANRERPVRRHRRS